MQKFQILSPFKISLKRHSFIIFLLNISEKSSTPSPLCTGWHVWPSVGKISSVRPTDNKVRDYLICSGSLGVSGLRRFLITTEWRSCVVPLDWSVTVTSDLLKRTGKHCNNYSGNLLRSLVENVYSAILKKWIRSWITSSWKSIGRVHDSRLPKRLLNGIQVGTESGGIHWNRLSLI